jgi:hypothetical protein
MIELFSLGFYPIGDIISQVAETFYQEVSTLEIQVSLDNWLGGRDSNPDRQIQNPEKDQAAQQDQGLTLADHGEVRRNPQLRRNKSDDALPPNEKKESDD